MKYNRNAEVVMAIGILIIVLSIGLLIIESLFFNETFLPVIILLCGLSLVLIGYFFGGSSEKEEKQDE